MAVKCLAFLVLMASTFSVNAEIAYNPNDNAIVVTGFPAETPCSPKNLYNADRAFGWEKVTFRKSDDTYTINCDLWIGDETGGDAYFQLGSVECPKETMILRGDLIIQPNLVKDAYNNPGTHRFTMGRSMDKTISPSLTFDCREKRCSFLAGFPAPAKNLTDKVRVGGEAMIYGGVISALDLNDKTRWIKQLAFRFRARLENCVIRGVAEKMSFLYGDYYSPSARGVTFEHGGAAITSLGELSLEDCVIQDCDYGVFDWGERGDLRMERCVFRNNRHNWHLAYLKTGVTAMDCVFDKPLEKNVLAATKNAKNGSFACPYVISRRHVIVKALFADGTPASGATVKIAARTGEADNELFYSSEAKTGKNGETPTRDAAGAIVLTEFIFRAMPGKPATEKYYAYTIETRAADGRTAVVSGVKPNENQQVIKVILNP